MRLKTLHVITVLLTGLAAVTTLALPDCAYDDPVVDTCRQDSDYPTSHSITCRSLSSNGTGDGGATFECKYFWCDLDTECPAYWIDGTKKERTKQWQFVQNWNSGTPCTSRYTVISTHDTEVDCCLCQMNTTVDN